MTKVAKFLQKEQDKRLAKFDGKVRNKSEIFIVLSGGR